MLRHVPGTSEAKARTAHPTLKIMDERIKASLRPKRSMGYPEQRQPNIIGRAAMLAGII